jgi:hypothetical protein
MVGYPMCVVCPIAHITITGLAALHIPPMGVPRLSADRPIFLRELWTGAKAGRAMGHFMYSETGVSRVTYAGSKRSYSRLTTA